MELAQANCLRNSNWIDSVTVCEAADGARRRASDVLHMLNFNHFDIVDSFNPQMLRGADMVMFAHRRESMQTAVLLGEADLQQWLKPGTIIADIGIDQGGTIDVGQSTAKELLAVEEVKARTEAMLAKYGGKYYAEVNMPREIPELASVWHGNAVLPYVFSLMRLAAERGGGEAALHTLLTYAHHGIEENCLAASLSAWDHVLHDLRNGLELAQFDGQLQITHPVTAEEPRILHYLTEEQAAA
jgi:alanine dehydrogenase